MSIRRKNVIMPKTHKWILALFVTAALGGCQETGEKGGTVSLEKSLPQLVEAGDVTGISLAVVTRGEPTRTIVYGVRNAETGEPVQEDTLFEAASLSKPVFACAVMRMVERGEVDLDTPLVTYLPYERLEHDERYKRITARMVLSHSGGLPNWGGTPLEMEFDPGERFGYSGEGYVYLQKVVEKITGMTLNQIVTREVFSPLGMNESSYVWADELEGRMATGHSSRGEPMKKNRREGGDGNAAASLLTTARDYARFLSAVLNREVLEPSTWEIVLEPEVQVVERETKEPVDNVFWGLGWGLQTGDAGKAFFHWGDNPGYKNYVIGYPDEGRGLVYFTNSDEGLSIADPIVAAFIPDSNDAIHWLNYEKYDAPGRLVRRSLEDAFFEQGVDAGTALYEKLRAEHPDVEFEPLMNRLGYALLRGESVDEAIAVFELNVEAFPESSNVYDSLAEACMTAGQDDRAIENYQRSYELDPENEGAQRAIAWIEEGREARKNAPQLSKQTLERFVGTYGPFQVSLREGSLFAAIEWRKKDYRLVPLSEDTFALEGYGTYRVRFVSDEEGRVVKAVGMSFSGRKTEVMREP
jgi:CubicO group peptidase (beta-lactamase class C family)